MPTTATRNRVLHLTSPLMSGDDVTALQTLLHNAGYYTTTVDGQYGPFTAQAVYRAKWYLGFPKSMLSQNVESRGLLVKVLSGKEQPTPAMVRAAKQRKAALSAKTIGAKMLDEAFKWVGTKESPANSNNVIFSRWYGYRGPWCAMFVSYCGVKVGSKAFKQSERYAYVPYVAADAKAGKNYLTLTTTPKYGSLVLYDWDKDGTPDHIGFFEAWLTGNSFSSVEGNTGYSDQSNGGEVQHRTTPHQRYKSSVFCFVNVTQ